MKIRKLKKRKKSPLSIIFLIFLILAGGSFFYYRERQYQYFISTPFEEDSQQRIPFIVSKGESVKKIASNLEKKGVIAPQSAWAFYRYAKENKGESIQAGNFILLPSQTIPSIFQDLQKGKTTELPITILEGWTMKEIDKKLVDSGMIAPGEFSGLDKKDLDLKILSENPTDSLEGYFFPDTYFINRETFTAKGFAERMVKNMAQKVTPEMRNKIADNKRNLHQIFTMASIVEKEERNKSEKAKIAGILWKRLDKGIVLGADATVLYALGDWKKPLTYKELEIDSPFNTRKLGGLPPHPICTISLSSLQAAIHPEESPYFYYLHDNEGQVHYARDNEGHNSNKRKYL